LNFFKYSISFIVLILFASAVFSQSFTISGTVTDGHTEEPVAYASVYFARSGIGKITDSLGQFSFSFNDFKDDTLKVSFIGFELYTIPVSRLKNNQVLNIQLKRGVAKGEVVVKAKWNRGLYLWKKIMSKKKQYNRYELSNFSYEAYNKLEIDIKNFNADKARKNFLLKSFSFVFDNIDSTSESAPFLPTYLVESLSDYAYQKSPKKFYENIKASKTVGFNNESFSKLLGVMDQNVSIYSNFVNVIDKDFISPFNDNADAYYIFTVPDTQIVNGAKQYHFVFRPKHAGQNTFEGDAWVTEKTYQIRRISMYLGKDANINFIDRVSIFQEYIPINDSVIFLNRDKFFADFRVLGKNSLTFIGRKTTSYKNIVINSDSLTTAFSGQRIKELITSEKSVVKNEESDWKDLRHDTLSKNEKTIYQTIDRLNATPKFKKLQTNLRFLVTGYRYVGKFEIGPWFNWISADTIQGTRLRFDLGTNDKLFKNVYLHTYLAYGFRDKRFKGKAEALWVVKRNPKWMRLHISYQDDIDNGISQLGEVSQDNIFSVAIRKKGIGRKFINVKDLRFDGITDLGKGFSTELFVSHRQYEPLTLNLPQLNNFSVKSGIPLTNFEVAVKFRFAYLEKFLTTDYNRISIGTKYPIVEAIISKGFKGVFNSAYNYTKYSLLVKDMMKISPYGVLYYRVYGGKIDGTLPFTNLENHPGNDLYYYNPFAFNLMSRFEYLSDKYAGVSIEHNIGSGLFRFIPLTRKLKFRQFYTIKSLWGSLSDANNAVNYTYDASGNKIPAFKTLNGRNYIEVGTGIDNILKVFRLDFVWRLAPSSSYAGSGSKFGIFGSFQLQF
jgi:hypothetical protein